MRISDGSSDVCSSDLVLTRRGHRVAPRRDRTAPLYARIEQDAAIPAMIVIVAQFQSPIGLAARSPALRQPLLRKAARPAFHKAADKPAPPAGPQPSARTTRQLPQQIGRAHV